MTRQNFRTGDNEYNMPEQPSRSRNRDQGREQRANEGRMYDRPGYSNQFDNEYERSRAQERVRNMRSMNFEAYAADGNRFINEVAYELGVDRNRAARITRAVLHAIRDRIPADDAIQFAQGLPMALKGIFIDRYDLSKAPVVIRHPEDFIDFICSKDGNASYADFPERRHVVEALKGVFRVLERNMDYGQVQQIKYMFNIEIAELFENY